MGDGQVKVFLTERKIGKHSYAEQICARSWREARAFAAKAGVRLIGLADSEYCANCLSGKPITPKPGLYDFPDTIEP